MKQTILIISFLVTWMNAANAGPLCYTPVELEAEQLLRLHSELMVITVTCRQSSSGESLVPMYTHFTKANLTELHAAEQTLIKYYGGQDSSPPVDKLDQLRTRLGNEFGQRIADLSAPEFCRLYRDKVMAMSHETREYIQQEVITMAKSQPSDAPSCVDSSSRIAKSN